MNNLNKLLEPFPETSIEWVVVNCGLRDNKPWAIICAYIDNRAIQQRLDDTVGAENWKNEFIKVDDGFLCGLSIKVGNEWVTKWDGASLTEYEPFKGGLSNAMKRSAVQWGIGRYLYNLDRSYANFNQNGKLSCKVEGKYYHYDAPTLPALALPKNNKPAKINDVSTLNSLRKKMFASFNGLGIKSEQLKNYFMANGYIKESTSEFTQEGLEDLIQSAKEMSDSIKNWLMGK